MVFMRLLGSVALNVCNGCSVRCKHDLKHSYDLNMLILPFIPFSGRSWAFFLCFLATGHHCIYIYISLINYFDLVYLFIHFIFLPAYKELNTIRTMSDCYLVGVFLRFSADFSKMPITLFQ
jgi:hypothetical protein